MNTYWILKNPQGRYYGDPKIMRRAAMYQLAHTSHAWRAMYSSGWRVVKVQLVEVKP